MKHFALTNRDLEVLGEVVGFLEYREKYGEGHEWVRPMDVGGSSRSHHNATLKKLLDRGLVERTFRSVMRGRGSFKYRATALGVTYVEEGLR